MSTRAFAIGLALAAVAGFSFASVSTLDFVQHLDRQVHDLHCSFAPGLVESDPESTGCQVTLLSPYSSVMRTAQWGGIPISLPAMAVFAFLGFRAFELWAAPLARRRTAASIALATAGVPVLASAVMGYIAFTELHAACKLCIGIYASSGVALLMAGLAWGSARRGSALAEVEDEPPSPPRAGLAWLSAAGQAFAFVTLPVVAYALWVPDYSRYIGTCGALIEPEDPYGVMVPLGARGSGAPAIEVFDPLCPACRGFEERLEASGLDARLDRRALLFPLDAECNWMVTRSLHPGACRVSEAVLCAAEAPGVEAEAVVRWAFEHQEALTAAGAAELASVTAMVGQRFPALRECLGSAAVKSRLNKSLRWTVTNELSVMTPQLYVAGTKLCDEDSDLGLEFTLERMLERHAAGQLQADSTRATVAAPSLVPGSRATPEPSAAARRSGQPGGAGRSGRPAAGASSERRDAGPGGAPPPAADSPNRAADPREPGSDAAPREPLAPGGVKSPAEPPAPGGAESPAEPSAPAKPEAPTEPAADAEEEEPRSPGALPSVEQLPPPSEGSDEE